VGSLYNGHFVYDQVSLKLLTILLGRKACNGSEKAIEVGGVTKIKLVSNI
jgi:hypothetical protein